MTDAFHIARGHKIGSWKAQAVDMYDLDGDTVAVYFEAGGVVVRMYGSNGLLIGTHHAATASRVLTKNIARSIVSNQNDA